VPEPGPDILESLRQGYEAFSSGDFDAALEFVHPDFEFVRAGELLAPIRGAEAFRRWMDPDAFDEQQVEMLDFEVNERRVLVHQVARNRGAASGIEMAVETWAVWTFDEEGLATRLEYFLVHEEDRARAAAGLAR
jgi:ketosteroid isomerase-like protein